MGRVLSTRNLRNPGTTQQSVRHCFLIYYARLVFMACCVDELTTPWCSETLCPLSIRFDCLGIRGRLPWWICQLTYRTKAGRTESFNTSPRLPAAVNAVPQGNRTMLLHKFRWCDGCNEDANYRSLEFNINNNYQ